MGSGARIQSRSPKSPPSAIRLTSTTPQPALSLVISLVPEISPVLEVVENLLLLGVDGRREGLDGAVDPERRRAQRGVGGSRCGWPGPGGSGSRGRRPGR